jgi:D-arabinono-1,4-lactone oxidase
VTVPAGLAAGEQPDTWGRFHPQDQAAVARLVISARAAGRRVRVRGAGHSVPAAIAGPPDLVLVLDRLRWIRFDDTSGEVTAGAGVRFGEDPSDPRRADGIALAPWLHARGRALANLGGILHQTVAGFLLTGSGGGSTRYDAAAAVVGLRLVDGTGAVRALRRGRDDDLLDAVLVSVGTCGVVTEVTFRTEAAFDAAGCETMTPDRGGPLDLFADGDTGLAAHLTRWDYARVLWWPQRRVRRIVAWSARRVAQDAPDPVRAYAPMPEVFGSTQPAQLVAGGLLWSIVHWRGALRRAGAGPLAVAERVAAPVEGALYRAFTTGPEQRFRGPWWSILPQDVLMDERWMPTTFTEIFVPLERSAEAMRRLDALFDAQPEAAGRFALELYAAPASSSWLHPAYQRASLRINVFWLMHAPEDPRDTFLPRIWDALAEFAPRLHWGKLYPHEPSRFVAGHYPRLSDFLAVRTRLDPDGTFLSEWMESALGIAGSTPAPAAPLPKGRSTKVQRHWPLFFTLAPGTLSTLDRADAVVDLERIIAAAPQVVLDAFFDELTGRDTPTLRGFIWHTAKGQLEDAVVDEVFSFMTLRMRTVFYEPGVRLGVSVDRSSLPLATELFQLWDVTSCDGGTRVRWRVALTYIPALALVTPPTLRIFRRLFEAVLDTVERRFAARA